MPDEAELLQHLYDRFNARDVDAVLAVLHKDVVWANGMEGGTVHGHDGVRSYWTRQWTLIDPHVRPMSFAVEGQGTIIATVHQTVRDLTGRLLADKVVGHAFRIEDGLVRRFDIRTLT
ncbi:nuclear transport factor 2 family protein [Rhodopila globiformis]|uniref:Ketosteroid isomerase n=1 Tax=Rhodopila globiformis TaxID=1071 RepID=A0A2S6N8B2_RHOGL|nr:nuclear transport factor 2 family protein [Rhodopila globiformis]PPQ30855.1 ketosteroid isomerase [Rhodopila globiformis]